MPSRRRHGLGVSFPSGNQTMRGALAVITSLLFAGCDANRPQVDSAPLAKSDVEVPQDVASEDVTTLDAMPSVEIASSSTLGGPLAGLDAADLARFTQGRDEFAEEDGLEEG